MASSSAASVSVSQSSQPTTDTSGSVSEVLKRKSNDVGREYGILCDPANLDKVKCILCGKIISGGVYRIKEHIAHIAGNVSKCPKSSKDDQLKCRNAINEAKIKNRKKKDGDESLRAGVNICGGKGNNDEAIDVDELQESFRSMKPPHSLSPIDQFARVISPESSLSLGKSMREQKINDALWKQRTSVVKEYVCKFFYDAGISFHAIEKDIFKTMVEAIGQFGPGFQPLTRYEMSEPYLNKEVEKTKRLLKTHEEEWKVNGCSIMTDAWSNRKRRSIMNLCVNSRMGTIFLSSKECSNEVHKSKFIYEYVEQCFQQVGPENVVQVVTDNSSNNMEATKLLKEKRPTIFWTLCATHTINLMLESIASLPRYKKVINQAKALTIFIYAHHKTLVIMRSYTKKRDIVRSEVTRFASSFLTLQSLVEKKAQLKTMFSSSEWDECKFSKTVKGKVSYTTVMSLGFWTGVTSCLKVFAPLVKVLRIVDGDRKPSMGFVYGELLQAKEDIKDALGRNVLKNYQSIIDIIDAKMKDRLDSPLHLMAYLLNPYYHYKDFLLHLDQVVSMGVLDCLDILFHDDLETQNKIFSEELLVYKMKQSTFGKPIVVKACSSIDDKFDPATWWSNFGAMTPHLQRIAMRILSLTTSSSGCERNWSTFEGIHIKKRNRLVSQRLNNLVFIQFNSNLMNKRKREMERNIEVLLASDASHAQGWIVDGAYDSDEVELVSGDVMGANGSPKAQKSSTMRELDEDDFSSETENEMNDNEFEFESDEERVLEEYGEEEEQQQQQQQQPKDM